MNETAHELLSSTTERIIRCAMHVHSALRPGLLESAYEVCLAHELERDGLRVARQVALPITYRDVRLEAGYRLDLLVEGSLVVEVKAIDKLVALHLAQLLSYLKLGDYRLGLLINFNVLHLRASCIFETVSSGWPTASHVFLCVLRG
jgi:GxxExxY protein